MKFARRKFLQMATGAATATVVSPFVVRSSFAQAPQVTLRLQQQLPAAAPVPMFLTPWAKKSRTNPAAASRSAYHSSSRIEPHVPQQHEEKVHRGVRLRFRRRAAASALFDALEAKQTRACASVGDAPVRWRPRPRARSSVPRLPSDCRVGIKQPASGRAVQAISITQTRICTMSVVLVRAVKTSPQCGSVLHDSNATGARIHGASGECRVVGRTRSRKDSSQFNFTASHMRPGCRRTPTVAPPQVLSGAGRAVFAVASRDA